MRRYKFLFFVVIWMAFGIITVQSVPSYPHKVRIAVVNGYADIFLHGDEHFKYGETEDGYTILPVADGWKYAMKNEQGNIVASNIFVTSYDSMDEKTKRFLQQIPKGIMPEMEINKSRRAFAQTTKGELVVGTRKALVILMQFQDVKLKKDKSDFDRLFNEENYKEDGAIGSVYDYYKWASYGQLDLKCDIVGPYTAEHMMAYYGGNSSINGGDKNPYALFDEAVNAAIKDIRLSDYDADGDGFVDNIHIVYAGYGEEAGASPNAIWAHEMTFGSIIKQGMKINKYSCAPELRGNRGTGISRIGPHCHEIGHALGAMDYYDTNYDTGGNYLGTGQWDIMAAGSWNNDGITPADFNPYVKVYNFGWTEPKDFVPDQTNVIKSSSQQGNIYRVDTGIPNDYFLLENRDGESFHAAEPGRGLLIFHIGPQLSVKAATNTINATYPQQCYPVCASSNYRRPTSSANTYGNINSAGCPFPGTSRNDSFSNKTIPAALTISGQDTEILLSHITMNGLDVNLFYGERDTSGDEPIPVTFFWSEDFEKMKVPSTWEYRDIKGLGEFSVVSKLSSGDTPQLPLAASGNSYLKFNSVPQSVIGRHRTEGQLTTSYIILDSGKRYHFSLKTRRYTKLIDACDTLSVSLIDSNNQVTTHLINTPVTLEKQWEECSAFLPDGPYEFSLAILCNIDYGSIMFIDDLQIIEYSGESGINGLRRESIDSTICSLDGLRVSNLKKGLNIVRMRDGTIRKVICR